MKLFQSKRLRFISVPQSIHAQFGRDAYIDHAIPLPVEIPKGKDTLHPEELSLEMIVSGMLLVITEGKEKQEWIDYYRHLVLAARPDILGELTEAAIIKAQGGDFDLALEILNALRGLFPSSAAVMLNRALVLEEKASLLELHKKAEASAAFQDARIAYTEALDLRPPSSEILYNAGFFFLGRKDFSRAKECFLQYIDSGDDEKKKETAASIIREINEDFMTAYELIMQGKYDAGLEIIRNYLTKHPSEWNGWFVLGWALRQTGRWKDGVAAFSKAIELGGSSSDIYNELAICLMESGDMKRARRELETALRNDSENIKIISNMGILALKNGDRDEAAAFFRTVLELDPDDTIANNFFKQ